MGRHFKKTLPSKIIFFQFFYFLFFLPLCCSTHGDEALVGRVTVNAIFLGILIAVSLFYLPLHCKDNQAPPKGSY